MAVSYSDLTENIARFIGAFESSYQKLKDDVVAHEQLIQDVANGERFNQSLSAFQAQKSQLNAALSPDLLATMLSPQWSEAMETIGRPLSLSQTERLKAFKQYLEDNSYTVKARNFSFGTPTANGSNTGDGEIIVLRTDEFGYDIEAGHIEAKEYRIVQDGTDNLNYRNNERGVFRGVARSNNFERSEMTKSNVNTPINVISETSGKLTNASFTNFPAGGSSTNHISNWTVGTPGNVTKNTTDYFRKNPNVATAVSAQISGTTTITQTLRNIPITTSKPYLLTFVYNRQAGSATGVEFDLTLGGKTKSFVLTGSETGWNRASLNIDEDLWPRNWATDEPTVEIEITAITGGYLLIDEVILYEMDEIDSHWYAVLGGETPFSAYTVISGDSIGDVFTWTDSLAGSDSIIQRYIGLLYGISFPSTTGSPTWSEPTVLDT